MLNNKYRLEYLPIFYDDLNEKVSYIAFELQNPAAANRLVDSVEAAIQERLPFAESFEPYHSRYDRESVYYRIYVDSFEIYYVVIDKEGGDKIMEVRRFLYSKQNKNKNKII